MQFNIFFIMQDFVLQIKGQAYNIINSTFYAP